MLKRVFDIAASGAGLVVAGIPICAAAYVMAKITGESGIYKQERVGLNGKPFTIYKIRTMSETRDEGGNLLPDHERVGRVGSFLRRTRIDELPQFWNILKGDMSIVGPRPTHKGQEILANDYMRHLVRPGVTGLAFMKRNSSHREGPKLVSDHAYVGVMLTGTFLQRAVMDTKIIVKTPFVMLHHVRQSPFNRRGQLSRARNPS